MRQRRRGAVWGLLVWVELGVACQDTRDERETLAQIAEPCSINSDCQNPNICVFERCHQPCTEDRDCPGTERCVHSPFEGVYVCQLPENVACMRDQDCWETQVCGIDDECRDPCLTAFECTPTQICAASGECASSDETRDVLDDNNNLVLGPASDAGTTSGTTGGTVQAGESRGPDPTASDTSGDAAAEASTASDVPDTTGSDTLEVSTETSSTGLEDASSEAGSTGDTDASGIAYYEPSDDAPDGNDTRELAIPLLGTASIYLPRGDRDWFSVQVPDDGRAHILTIHFQQSAPLSTTIGVYAAADDSLIHQQPLGLGVTAEFTVSVGPGTTTLISCAPQAGNDGGRAELWVEQSGEQDEHEPNQDPAAAAVITVNEDVTAQLVIPYTSTSDQDEEDWFSIELGAGDATLNVTQIPEDLRMGIYLRDSNGVEVDQIVTSAGQFRLTAEFSGLQSGSYFLQFQGLRAASFDAYSAVGQQRGYFFNPYMFRVEQ